MEEDKPELGGGAEAKLAESADAAKKKRTASNLIKMSTGKDGFRKTKHLTRKELDKHYRILQVNFNTLSATTSKQNSILQAYIALSSMALGELHMADPKNHMFQTKGGISAGMLKEAIEYKRPEPKKEPDIKKEKKTDVSVQDKAV